VSPCPPLVLDEEKDNIDLSGLRSQVLCFSETPDLRTDQPGGLLETPDLQVRSRSRLQVLGDDSCENFGKTNHVTTSLVRSNPVQINLYTVTWSGTKLTNPKGFENVLETPRKVEGVS
jgi:hypothetical protein